MSCDTSTNTRKDNTKEEVAESPVIHSEEENESSTQERPAIREEQPVSTAPEVPADTITGRWLRPDGNYILEIRSIGDDNTLVAAYFNPSPINIALAELKDVEGIRVYVEFDDTNYKGSYYDLRYDQVNDALTGNYYQATYGQTYQIAFIRMEE